MLLDSKLDVKFWKEAMMCAIYFNNRSPTAAGNNKTSEEAFTGKRVDVSQLRVFGSKAFKPIPKTLMKKFNTRCEEFIMAG